MRSPGQIPNDTRNLVRQSKLEDQTTEHATITILRQLDVSLAALMIFVNGIDQHMRSGESSDDSVRLQNILANAAQQTARACALVKQLSDCHLEQAIAADVPRVRHDAEISAGISRGTAASSKGSPALTQREAEVLALITEGYSNKEGAMRMRISWRTFESHRANIIRKLSARNTADLIRKTLLLNMDREKNPELVSNPGVDWLSRHS